MEFRRLSMYRGKTENFLFYKNISKFIARVESPPLKRNKVRKWEEGGGGGAGRDANWQCETIWRNQQLLRPRHVMSWMCHVPPYLWCAPRALSFAAKHSEKIKKSPTTTTTATPALSNTDRMRRQTLNMVVAVVVKWNGIVEKGKMSHGKKTTRRREQPESAGKTDDRHITPWLSLFFLGGFKISNAEFFKRNDDLTLELLWHHGTTNRRLKKHV